MRDNWCVGYTARFTVGVWVGNSSGAPMQDVSGVTGAAPVWLDVMNYLYDRFGGGEIQRPSDVLSREVIFPKSIEPPRREWFIAGTEPNSAAKRLDSASVRIVSPAPGTIVALDPDIAPDLQRVAFEAADAPPLSRWIFDGHLLAADAGIFLWPPAPGPHTLAVADSSGQILNTVMFSVRGRQSSHSLSNDSTADDQLQ
jgi:penicillin-binding protein 1C